MRRIETHTQIKHTNTAPHHTTMISAPTKSPILCVLKESTKLLLEQKSAAKVFVDAEVEVGTADYTSRNVTVKCSLER